VAHTYQVIASLRVVLGDAQDAETGQRGYILTHQQSFLQPYEIARGRVVRDLNRFRQLTADNPSQQRRAEALSQLVRDRFSAFDMTLAQAVAGGTTATPAIIQALNAASRGRRRHGRGAGPVAGPQPAARSAADL
jgi:CHASE3 domain sensor protein